MRKIYFFLLLLGIFTSCVKDPDDNPPPASDNPFLEVNDFVWKSLNFYYLWQNEVLDLSDHRFASSPAKTTLYLDNYRDFLNQFSSPKELFKALLYHKDRFSFIVEDYRELEQQFQGISKSTGMNFSLLLRSSDSDEVIGAVRYVIPQSSAAKAGVKRGVIFSEVNGIPLTRKNYQTLLFSKESSFSINSLSYTGENFVSTGKTYRLTKEEINENPIYLSKVITHQGKKIGYLMYNSFLFNYDRQLNEVFAQMKSEGIEELILDLRYNPGGSVSSAIHLASMITGQFDGRLFLRNRWNEKLQPIRRNTSYNFTSQLDDGTAINHLQLKRLFVIATGNTASASELVINGLRPYIEVIHIGMTTVGKNQGSITIKDNSSNGKTKPQHFWALQPIVFKIENANGFGDYEEGLSPNFEIKERISNLGELGSPQEPLLQKALSVIFGETEGIAQPAQEEPFISISDSNSHSPIYQHMYIKNP